MDILSDYSISRMGRQVWTCLLQQSKILARIEAQQVDLQQAQIDTRKQYLSTSLEMSCDPGSSSSQDNENVIRNPSARAFRGHWTNKAGAQLTLSVTRENRGNVYQLHLQFKLPGLSKMFNICLSVGFASFVSSTHLNYSNVVPDDSAIAVACRIGDVDTARELFRQRRAHPTDVVMSRGHCCDSLLNVS